MTDATSQNIYDRVPYPSLSYSQSHPDRLAAIATLLGMTPPPIKRCRVLELGCASGGNLLPMAYGLPESEFVGIDYSARQIAEGQETAAALGLRNIVLKHMDILDVNADLGQFDYIVAHGVFSWVPRPVQDKLLEVCKQALAPDGVAYISYNTYPGWNMMGTIREMMLFHTRRLNEPQERVTQARALLDFLSEAVPSDTSAYGYFLGTYAEFLQGELKGPRASGDSFLLHDELEEVNDPIYFYQFVERAAGHGLQYLGEAEFRTMVGSNFDPKVFRKLGEMSRSVIDLEQYMDFLRNRMFRQTLLCHKGIKTSRTLMPKQLQSFLLASYARPDTLELDLHSNSVVKFNGSDGATLSTDHPVTKAAMLCLALEWPQAMSFDTLLAKARARLGPEGASAEGSEDAARDAQILGANLLKAYSYSGTLLELHVHEPHMVLEVSERPIASALARLQARTSARVTNLRHERVRVDEFDRYLLPYLDGSSDPASLLEKLKAGPVARGDLKLEREGEPITDPEQVDDVLAQGIEKRLGWLARAALLEG